MVKAALVKDVRVSSPLFIPASKGGQLASKLKEEDNKLGEITGWKFKVIERGGIMLKNLLTRANLFSKEDCGRPDCQACKKALKPFDCRTLRSPEGTPTCLNTGPSTMMVKKLHSR